MARPYTGKAYELLGVRIPQEQMRRLKQLEGATGKSVAEHARLALENYLEQATVAPVEVSAVPMVLKIVEEMKAQMQALEQVVRPGRARGRSIRVASAGEVERVAEPAGVVEAEVEPELPGLVALEGSEVEGDREAVSVQIRQLRAQELSLSQIAARLNEAGVPTFSGKGTWAKGSVERVLSGRKTAVKG